jgi:hypothetical protein
METHLRKSIHIQASIPESKNCIVLMAGILARPGVDVFPFALRLTVTMWFNLTPYLT